MFYKWNIKKIKIKTKQFVDTNFKWIVGEISTQIERNGDFVTRAMSTRSSTNNGSESSGDLYFGDINLKFEKESIQSSPRDDILLNFIYLFIHLKKSLLIDHLMLYN